MNQNAHASLRYVMIAIGALGCGGILAIAWARFADVSAQLQIAIDADASEMLRRHAEAIEGIADRMTATEARLDELAQTVAAIADANARTRVPPDAGPQLLTPAQGPADAKDALRGQSVAALEELRRIALDPRRPVRDRVVAVSSLWEIDRKAGLSGSRTPEMVTFLLDALEAEPNADVRRQICLNVLDALQPWHKAPLLRALRNDVDEKVRAQAADSLQDLQGEPDVRSALQWASTNDAAEIVRTTAQEMLRRWDTRR